MCPVCKRKVFAHDEQPVPDSDSDSDADDTTPLINPVNRNTHGTFTTQNENPFQRAARSVSQITEGEQGYQNEGKWNQKNNHFNSIKTAILFFWTKGIFVTASGEHSINTETIDDDSSNSSYSSVTSAREVTVLPSNNDNNSRNRDLVI